MSKLRNLVKDLEKANQRLQEARSLKPARVHKDATIQRFEFTFELAWKTVQEYIRDQGLDCHSPKSCFRQAVKLDLIEDIETWFDFLDNRNRIAHTYNEAMTDAVYKKALQFPQEVDTLLTNLT